MVDSAYEKHNNRPLKLISSHETMTVEIKYVTEQTLFKYVTEKALDYKNHVLC